MAGLLDLSVMAPTFDTIVGTTGVFTPSEAPSFYDMDAFGDSFSSRPGMIGKGESWEQPGQSFYQEDINQFGFWRTSNHSGLMGSSNWTFGSPGGSQLQSNFWVYDNPVSEYISYSDLEWF
jgi:hypothetical protein